MMNEDQWDREEQEIERAYDDGEITLQERNKRLADLARDYRAAAREAAENAYDRELEGW